MVHLERVRFGYGDDDNLLCLDEFVVERESNVLIVGPSGCGKTTLLHLLAGLLLARAGRVIIDGQDLGQLSPAARDRFRGKNIGIVLQQFHLLPTLTALQNLLVAQSAARLPANRAAARAVLETLGVVDCADAYPHQLSVGQQQRVAIARALVNAPRLVLADEPTSSLDDEACAAVTNLLLASIRGQGSTLVIATHDSRLKALIERQLILSRPAAGARR